MPRKPKKRNDVMERSGSAFVNSTHSRTHSVSNALTTVSTFLLKRYITSNLCRKAAHMMRQIWLACVDLAMQGFTHSEATVGTGTERETLRKASRTALSFAVMSYKAR